MVNILIQKSLSILLKQQTNILSAAFVIMATIILSQLLGLVRLRLLGAYFGGETGVFLAASKFPDLLFQIIIAGALSSAFIPVFSDFLTKNKQEDAYKMASTLLLFGTIIFTIISLFLFIFTPFFLQIVNPGSGFTSSQMDTMAQIMRILIISQFFFIVGTFFSALLQSYNHFFIPGIAAALYNFGMIVGILLFGNNVGIVSAAYGSIIGASLFCLFQIPTIKKVGFTFLPTLSLKTQGVTEVFHLMWPRTISLAVLQFSSLAMLSLISFFPAAAKNYTAFDYAQTLAFAPILLISAIAQAAFPVLAREKDRMNDFKSTFLTSFAQMFYLSLPISVLLLVLRIPIVRLIFGAGQFDWDTTVLTGRTLAFFSLSLFAQVLIALTARAFYALHDTKTPLIVGTSTTILTIALSALFINIHRMGIGPLSIPYPFFGIIKGSFVFRFGIESVALAYSIGNILNLVILLSFLGKKVNGFDRQTFLNSTGKVLLGAFLTGFALYIPIKLLDQLVFDTTRTVNLIVLTGISSLAGLSLYLFLTWLLNVKEASLFIQLFQRLGNWREILARSEEPIEPTRLNP